MTLLNPHAFLEEVLVSPDDTARHVATSLISAGAIIVDHVVLASMAHAGIYFNVKELFSGNHPDALADIAMIIARQCRGLGIQTIVGPETGGSRLAEAVRDPLSRMDENENIHVVGARKTNAKHGPRFDFRPEDTHLVRRHRVLLVEDVITTADSMAEVRELIWRTGGAVINSIVVVDRTPFDFVALARKIGFVTLGLMKVAVPTFPENTPCPMCEASIPVRADLGRGRVFLEQQARKN